MVSVIVASITVSYFHMVYTADSIASFAGYFISLAILPAIVGALIGSIGVSTLEKNIKGIKTYWWVPAIGSIASLVPVTYVLFMMS